MLSRDGLLGGCFNICISREMCESMISKTTKNVNHRFKPFHAMDHSLVFACLRWALGGCFLTQSQGARVNLCLMKMYESIFFVPSFPR